VNILNEMILKIFSKLNDTMILWKISNLCPSYWGG